MDIVDKATKGEDERMNATLDVIDNRHQSTHKLPWAAMWSLFSTFVSALPPRNRHSRTLGRKASR